jgi:ubiquitin carboxyl-terminal hydrolase 7
VIWKWRQSADLQEIPVEELEAADRDNAKIVNLFHYAKDPQRTHGVPCKFVLYEGEIFEETRKRIQQRIGANDKDFARFKFSLVTATVYKQPTSIEDRTSPSFRNLAGADLNRGYPVRPQVDRRGCDRARSP